MEVPGPRMSLLSGPTHRKCLSTLFEHTDKKKSPFSGVIDRGSLNNEDADPGARILCLV